MRSPCCLCPPPPIVARKRAVANYYYYISLFVSVSVCPSNVFVLYAVSVASKESRRLIPPGTSCLPGGTPLQRVLKLVQTSFFRY
jgi:hypothetical protein